MANSKRFALAIVVLLIAPLVLIIAHRQHKNHVRETQEKAEVTSAAIAYLAQKLGKDKSDIVQHARTRLEAVGHRASRQPVWVVSVQFLVPDVGFTSQHTYYVRVEGGKCEYLGDHAGGRAD